MRFSFFGIHGEITTMPGCSQIGISHNVFSSKPGSGKGKVANAARTVMMKELGYDYALCTCDSANEAQVNILESCGWYHLNSFKSSKTGHIVRLYGKALNDPD